MREGEKTREGRLRLGREKEGKWRETEKKSKERRRKRQEILSFFLLLGIQRFTCIAFFASAY